MGDIVMHEKWAVTAHRTTQVKHVHVVIAVNLQSSRKVYGDHQ